MCPETLPKFISRPGAGRRRTLPCWPSAILGATGNNLLVHGWLYDVKNVGSPQVLGKQYTDAATADAARMIAHKFADEIIFRLGGGVPGIAESKIYFVSDRSGHKEIWAMDYDGSNQHQITHLGSISLSPRISPDGSRLAFSSLDQDELGNPDVFARPEPAGVVPTFGGTNLSPTWSPDGTRLAFRPPGAANPNIYVADAAGGNSHRLTSDRGPDVGPTLEPQDGRADRFCQRPHRPAADLHHGSGRNQRADA